MPIVAVSPRSHRGFTAAELLVALLAGSILTLALASFFAFQTNSLKAENASRSAQVTARTTLDFVARHLEHVGRDPSASLFSVASPAIQTADADELSYLANLNEDWETPPDTSDGWESVTFRYDPETAAIMVDEGANSYALTDVGENQRSYVPPGGLSFTYFDAGGNAVAAGGAIAQRASIRRITVAVTVRGVSPDGSAEDPEVTHSRDVYLRNVSG